MKKNRQAVIQFPVDINHQTGSNLKTNKQNDHIIYDILRGRPAYCLFCSYMQNVSGDKCECIGVNKQFLVQPFLGWTPIIREIS